MLCGGFSAVYPSNNALSCVSEQEAGYAWGIAEEENGF
jgi:hypothetical protein